MFGEVVVRQARCESSAFFFTPNSVDVQLWVPQAPGPVNRISLRGIDSKAIKTEEEETTEEERGPRKM
ncbi:hypothetical protein RUM44_004843 [Polyplax serrata]|uniref:Uncharacterized protein n=1 Tax=Polyplax serrata TaxID=468196 RepID=A0ABR1B419_POLSC